jgi:hypothetical protein
MVRCTVISKVKLSLALEAYMGCEMLMIPRCLDSRIIDGGYGVSLTRHSRFTLPEISFGTISLRR